MLAEYTRAQERERRTHGHRETVRQRDRETKRQTIRHADMDILPGHIGHEPGLEVKQAARALDAHQSARAHCMRVHDHCESFCECFFG